MMRGKTWIAASAFLLTVALTGCASEPLYDLDDHAETINLTDDDYRSETLPEEEKAKQYKDFLVQACQEALKKLEGIEDISIDLGDEAEDYKVKVQVAFEEAVGDKEGIKETIEKILQGFFSEMEGALIEFEETAAPEE